MRRTHIRAKPGQLYSHVWIEWHASCADCGAENVLLDMGPADTIKQAERYLRDHPNPDGWRRIKGKWYCKDCTNQILGGSKK